MSDRRRTTMKDIATEVGVSTATVSVALAGRRVGVSIGDETRERVRDAAERLGYDLGRLRSTKALRRTIVTFCPGSVHPNVPILYGVLLELSERLGHHGMRMLVESGHGPSRSPESAERFFRRGEADGAIVISLGNWAEHMESWSVPSVFIGALPNANGVSHVKVDDQLGGRLAAEHLWSLGHRHVGVLHMWGGSWGVDREEGFRSVWESRGAELPHEMCVRLEEPQEAYVADAVSRLFELAQARGEKLTALFCDADWVACHAMRVVRQLGLRVPEDMSVVGFDDAHYATLLDPPLTTVRQPFAEIGALAVELLLEQLSLGERVVRSYALPCELRVRGSTGPTGGDEPTQSGT